jgi:hypothetical protein
MHHYSNNDFRFTLNVLSFLSIFISSGYVITYRIRYPTYVLYIPNLVTELVKYWGGTLLSLQGYIRIISYFEYCLLNRVQQEDWKKTKGKQMV